MFVLFSSVCAIFSVFGFVFAFCVAWTVAAQSGAMAGLGLAFVSKPILFEVDIMKGRERLGGLRVDCSERMKGVREIGWGEGGEYP